MTSYGQSKAIKAEFFFDAFVLKKLDSLDVDEFVCHQNPASLLQRLQKDW